MKLPIAALLLALATVTACSESPPRDIPAILPRYAFKPQVEDYYPSASRSLKEQGTTQIRLCYDDQGRPRDVTVHESSTFSRLDEAALRWGKAVRVTPGIFRRQPQPGCTKIPVKFSLEESQKPPDWREELLLPPVEPPEILIIPPPVSPPPQPIPLAPYSPDRSIPL